MAGGLVEECGALINTPWEPFVERKGFIGYREIFSYLRSDGSSTSTRMYVSDGGTTWIAVTTAS